MCALYIYFLDKLNLPYMCFFCYRGEDGMRRGKEGWSYSIPERRNEPYIMNLYFPIFY